MQKYLSGNLGDVLLLAMDFVQVHTMLFKVHPYSSFTPSNKHNLVTGRLSLSVAPFAHTSTVLINPSAPGNKFLTCPKAHWFLATLSSATRTMSQT